MVSSGSGQRLGCWEAGRQGAAAAQMTRLWGMSELLWATVGYGLALCRRKALG